jgi:drug/metabolite transporter (DMT)-like permease
LKDHRKGILAVLIAAILWSTSGVFVKLISLSSLQILFFRSVFSTLTVLAIFKKDAVRVNTLTIVNGLFYSGILIGFVTSTKMTTAANAIFLQYTAPIYVLILEPLLLKTKFERVNIITIIISFIGMSLFFIGKLSPGDFRGNIIALLSGVAFAAFLLGMRKNKPEYQFSSIFYGNIFVCLFCSFSVWGIKEIPLKDFMMIAYLGIFQIGVAYSVFSYGLKKVYAIEASLISMIEPVLNPVWTFFGYGEVPSIFAIIGGVIILIAIAIRELLLDKFVYAKRNLRS